MRPSCLCVLTSLLVKAAPWVSSTPGAADRRLSSAPFPSPSSSPNYHAQLVRTFCACRSAALRTFRRSRSANTHSVPGSGWVFFSSSTRLCFRATESRVRRLSHDKSKLDLFSCLFLEVFVVLTPLNSNCSLSASVYSSNNKKSILTNFNFLFLV